MPISAGEGAVTSTPHTTRFRPRLNHHSFHGERHGRLRSYSVSFQVWIQVIKTKQIITKTNSIFQENGFCFRETTNDAINPDWDCTFQKDDTPIRQNFRQNESSRNSRQIESPSVEIPGSFTTDEYESADEDVIVDCDEKEKLIKIRKPKSERRQMSKRWVFTIT